MDGNMKQLRETKMEDLNLVNYEPKTSSSNDYMISPSSSCPDSFPNVVGSGIMVEYHYAIYGSEITEEDKLPQPLSNTE